MYTAFLNSEVKMQTPEPERHHTWRTKLPQVAQGKTFQNLTKRSILRATSFWDSSPNQLCVLFFRPVIFSIKRKSVLSWSNTAPSQDKTWASTPSVVVKSKPDKRRPSHKSWKPVLCEHTHPCSSSSCIVYNRHLNKRSQRVQTSCCYSQGDRKWDSRIWDARLDSSSNVLSLSYPQFLVIQLTPHWAPCWQDWIHFRVHHSELFSYGRKIICRSHLYDGTDVTRWCFCPGWASVAFSEIPTWKQRSTTIMYGDGQVSGFQFISFLNP